jgi:hypothetical protein
VAYFANGDEGQHFDDLCESLCPIGRAGQQCPVRGAHVEFNYEQCVEGHEPLEKVLNMLVSRDKDGMGYPTCHMLEAMRRAIWLVEQECAHITAVRVKDREEAGREA